MQFSAGNIALKKHGVRSEKKMRDIPSWLQANQHANSFLGTRLSQDSKQIWMIDDSKDVLYSHIIIYFRITYLRIQTKRSMCYRLNLPTRTKYPTKNMLGSRCL